MGKEYAILNINPGKMNNPFMWTDELKQSAKEIFVKKSIYNGEDKNADDFIQSQLKDLLTTEKE